MLAHYLGGRQSGTIELQVIWATTPQLIIRTIKQ
jgi:hypothetical protein